MKNYRIYFMRAMRRAIEEHLFAWEQALQPITTCSNAARRAKEIA
jgi:hypothetical protein